MPGITFRVFAYHAQEHLKETTKNLLVQPQFLVAMTDITLP